MGCGKRSKKSSPGGGGLDVPINNVGGSNAPIGGFRVLTNEHWHQALVVNLITTVRLDRAFVP